MPTPSAIGTIVANVCNAIEAELPVLNTIPSVPAQIVQQITEAVDSLKQAAQAFASSDAPGDVAQRVSTDINAVLAAVAQVAPLLPPQFRLAFTLAQILLPSLEAGVQLLIAQKAHA